MLEGEFSQRKADGVKAIKVQMKKTLRLCVDFRQESNLRIRHEVSDSEAFLLSQSVKSRQCIPLATQL